MIELIDIQTLSIVVAALGFAVTCTYYIINLRNTEKIRRRDQVFQKLQLNMMQWWDVFFDVMYKYTDFKSVEEFRSKYGYYENPEAHKKIFYVLNHYNSLGSLLKDDLIDADLLFQLYIPWSFMTVYERFELPCIKPQGVLPNGVVYDPTSYHGIKYLYAEAKKRYPKLDYPALRTREEFVERGRMFDELFKKNPQLNM